MTNRPLVYVAGPVSADPMKAVRDGVAAWHKLFHLGFAPAIPQLSVIQNMIQEEPYEAWLDFDFNLIRRCDALFLLARSPGADREVAYCNEIGIPVFTTVESLQTWKTADYDNR